MPRKRRPAVAVLLWLGLLLAVSPALAQEVQRIVVNLRVTHVSQKAPARVDPAAEDINRRLPPDVKRRSVEVLEARNLDLAMNETGSLQLPTGRWVTVRPRKVGPTGVLMTVEVEGMLRTSLRIPNHHMVMIGAQNYQDGKLLVSLEPRY